MNTDRFLSKSKISAEIPDFSGTIEIFESIDSTNSEARRRIGSGLKEDAIFIAKAQTGGRGRRGRSFYSPEGGLYFSFVLHKTAALKDATLITAATAVAVADSIKAATKNDPKIKWVNDIFIADKKVCGILVEAVADCSTADLKAVIIGIGINLTTANFPEELREIAGSVNADPDRNSLIANIFKAVSYYCADLQNHGFMNAYRQYSNVLGRRITFQRNGIDYSAIAAEITDKGELVVKTDSGESLTLSSGEISVKF